MQCTKIHDVTYLKVLWDQESHIIGIDWKESTAGMTDDNFKSELMSFAGHVEARRAQGILADVAHFRHAMGPDMQDWRVKNISGRYFAAGVRRFAFLFPAGASIPPAMNESAPGESFVTRAFNDGAKGDDLADRDRLRCPATTETTASSSKRKLRLSREASEPPYCSLV